MIAMVDIKSVEYTKRAPNGVREAFVFRGIEQPARLVSEQEMSRVQANGFVHGGRYNHSCFPGLRAGAVSVTALFRPYL